MRDNAETHPSWVLIGASRVTSSPPGKALFDSDIRHQHYVLITLEEADRARDLHRDHIMGWKRIVEVAMSEAQWASFVSSMNSSGVPATLQSRDGIDMPQVPYEPRLAESMDEVRDAAHKAQEEVLAAYVAYEEHKTAANLRSLRSTINNLPANIVYAAESLSEHAENVVQRARVDIEAFVTDKARQLGIEPGEIAEGPLLLGEGDVDGDAD